EIILVNDMHPIRKVFSKRMTRSPHRLGGKRIVIAWDQKNRRMGADTIAQHRGKSLPEVRGGGGVIEQVAGAQHGVHRITPCDIEDCPDHVHPRARQLLLRLFGEGWKPPPKMPVRRMQQLDHDVFGFAGAIRNATWNNRVTVGAWYRRS